MNIITPHQIVCNRFSTMFWVTTAWLNILVGIQNNSLWKWKYVVWSIFYAVAFSELRDKINESNLNYFSGNLRNFYFPINQCKFFSVWDIKVFWKLLSMLYNSWKILLVISNKDKIIWHFSSIETKVFFNLHNLSLRKWDQLQKDIKYKWKQSLINKKINPWISIQIANKTRNRENGKLT